VVRQQAWLTWWGDRPYDPHQNPAENVFVSLGALGEGWHNWHHAFPYDYSCSELGISQQFNPTRFLIDTFAAFGLAYDRKTATHIWEQRKQKLQQSEQQNAQKAPRSEPSPRGVADFHHMQ